jgi:hypothetical protein
LNNTFAVAVMFQDVVQAVRRKNWPLVQEVNEVKGSKGKERRSAEIAREKTGELAC